MGKTTNTLLSAGIIINIIIYHHHCILLSSLKLGDFALSGQVYVDSLRTMHINACTALGLPDNTVRYTTTTTTTITTTTTVNNTCDVS